MAHILDAYCCQGGASRGYVDAGHTVEGVDLFDKYSRARYPYVSHKGDAIAFIRREGHRFDVIHASPPCQRHSRGTAAIDRSGYPDLIAATREAIVETGKPYIIENVFDARDELINPVMLCGCMFDLKAVDTDGILLHMTRKRMFETSFPLAAPKPCNDSHMEWIGGSYGGARRDKYEAKYVRKGGYVPSIPVQQELLGIDWMTQTAMWQALPPVYTEWIGQHIPC